MSHGPSARAEQMARMAQAAVGGEPVRDLSPSAREQRTSRHQILKNLCSARHSRSPSLPVLSRSFEP